MRLTLDIEIPDCILEKAIDEGDDQGAQHNAKYVFHDCGVELPDVCPGIGDCKVRMGIRRKNKKDRFWGEIYFYKILKDNK